MSAKNVRRSRFSDTPAGDFPINGQQQPLQPAQGPVVLSTACLEELVAIKKREIEEQKKEIERRQVRQRHAELVAQLTNNKLLPNVTISSG